MDAFIFLDVFLFKSLSYYLTIVDEFQYVLPNGQSGYI